MRGFLHGVKIVPFVASADGMESNVVKFKERDDLFGRDFTASQIVSLILRQQTG